MALYLLLAAGRLYSCENKSGTQSYTEKPRSFTEKEREICFFTHGGRRSRRSLLRK